jgi:hypothetical protein
LLGFLIRESKPEIVHAYSIISCSMALIIIVYLLQTRRILLHIVNWTFGILVLPFSFTGTIKGKFGLRGR